MTEGTVALKAYERLAARGAVPPSTIPRLASLVPQAKRRLALLIHADPRRRDKLRKSFALTVTSGSASLSAALADAEPLILETVRAADIRSASSSFKWQWKGNRSLLTLNPAGTDFIGYTLEGQTLYADTADTSATMLAGYEPNLASVEAAGLNDELIELVVMMTGQEVAA